MRRFSSACLSVQSRLFQSTHPSWGATRRIHTASLYNTRFQSTHPSWGATMPSISSAALACLFQSTHPSWGATRHSKVSTVSRDISIHAPIVGCDKNTFIRIYLFLRFQSTHPSWGATLTTSISFCSGKYFNPRTHRGVRPLLKSDCSNCINYFNPRTHRGVRRLNNMYANNSRQ